MQVSDILEAIESGQVDSHLDMIREVISDRKTILGRRKHRQFSVGDVVRFVGLGAGAKYMNGETAVITEINPKTVWVRLTPESKHNLVNTRFGRSSKIKVYPNSIEFAYLDGIAQPALKKIEDYYVQSKTVDGVTTNYNPDGSIKNVTGL